MRRLLIYLVPLLIVITACDMSRQDAATPLPTPTEDEMPVSQILETNSAAATLRPTRTPEPTATRPRPSPTPACIDAPRTRLIIGERGQVSDNDPEPLNVRSGPGTGFTILGILETYDVFDVLDGPRCGGEYAWFLVTDGDLQGWIAEGEFTFYYVEPYLPG